MKTITTREYTYDQNGRVIKEITTAEEVYEQSKPNTGTVTTQTRFPNEVLCGSGGQASTCGACVGGSNIP